MASNDELAKKVATLTIINQALKSENEEVCAPARLWVCRPGAHRPCLRCAHTRCGVAKTTQLRVRVEEAGDADLAVRACLLSARVASVHAHAG